MLGKSFGVGLLFLFFIFNFIQSDERSGEGLKNRILGAVASAQSLKSKKPNLVIVDEIDGASSSGGETVD